ncbi:hypothetical protein HD806DRAFT_527687 [Xylariaceae sp. AK1471]|nr:hypothetical protein HD806DRAFT_527687 [Xylariaceae sp. AK1471]
MKRTYHKKSKTGCATCKKRRVKCDETKPHCNRCESTGRRCDGYIQPRDNQPDSETATTSRSSSPHGPPTSADHESFIYPGHQSPMELRVALPRSNLKEVRSYHFFLEVAAPMLAGVFDVDFWIVEIPRACFVDRAIWHAAVSLGAVYEVYLARNTPRAVPSADHSYEDDFALQQCNLSIRSLTESSSCKTDKWRTLTASVLFTYLCSLQNLHEQSRMHLTAGQRILEAIQKDERKKRLNPTPGEYDQEVVIIRSSPVIPVSVPTLQAIIANLESHAKALDNGGLTYETTFNHNYNLWHFYRAPPSIGLVAAPAPLTRPVVLQYATREHVINANRAAESLLYGLVLYSQKISDRLADVIKKGDKESLDALIQGQEPYSRCFAEISSALHAFNIETGACIDNIQGAEFADRSTFKALLSLRLFVTTIRLLLFRNPESPDQQISTTYLCTQYRDIVDLAERILQLDNSDRSSFIPSPSPTQSLFLVAHSGLPQTIRRRAISLLRAHPRCSGLWDTTFSAALAEMMMEHEQTVARQRATSEELEDVTPTQSNDSDAESGVVNPLDRIHSYRVIFQRDRQAIVSRRTWKDFLDGLPETQSLLIW